MKKEEIMDKLQEIENDIATVYLFVKDESYADAYTYVDEIVDELIDINDKIKNLWKEAGGVNENK